LIAKKAYDDNSTPKEAALELKFVTEQQFDKWVIPVNMTELIK